MSGHALVVAGGANHMVRRACCGIARTAMAFALGYLKAAMRAVESGLYICYLPEAIARDRKLLPLKITGCPYKCETEVFMLARKSTEFSWVRSLFG